MSVKFSVLIANYNNSKYLNECVYSVINQSFQNFEIIIVDDTSTDDSIHVIEQLVKQDSRIKFFRNDENRGAGYTKKRCLDLSEGEICGYLDPDDKLTPNALESMVSNHLANPNASLVYSNHYLCDENLNVQGISTYTKQQPEGVSLLDEIYISHFVSFKKNLYQLTVGLNPTYKRAVDHDLYFLMEDVGELIHLNTELYYYRKHPGSISLNKNKYKAEYWDWIIRHNHAMRKGRNLEEEFSTRMLATKEMPGRFGSFLYSFYEFYIKLKSKIFKN